MNDDKTFINFLGNISVINNCNHIKNINNKNSTHWIIDSGKGINLTNDHGNLKNINVKNKSIIYPNSNIDIVEYVYSYIGYFKNNKFTMSDVHYASNIKNNLISTHSILDN